MWSRSLRSRRTTAFWLGIAACGALAMPGCTDAGTNHPTPTAGNSLSSPSASPASPASAASAAAREPGEALNAYRAMWADFVAAARTSNADSPVLPRHASGAALRLIRDGLRADRKGGRVTRGWLQLHPRLVSVEPKDDPRRVRVRDCADDTHWLLYTRSGRRASGEPPGRHHVEALVTRSGGVWKVNAFFVEKAGTC